MKREPVAMAQTWQVRVVPKKDDFLSSLLDCVSSWRQENREFAQSTLINVDSHGVVGGLCFSNPMATSYNPMPNKPLSSSWRKQK